ncbi:MAG: ABC transporter substrate-binding protein [Pseudomonadota bacterium]
MKNIKLLALLFSFALSFSLFAENKNVNTNSPMSVIKNTIAKVEKLVDKGLDSDDVQDKIKKEIRQMFDYDYLAKEAISAHWSKLTSAKQERYKTLFRELIERAYITKAKSYVGDQHNVKFTKENIKGKKADVFCNVAQKEVDAEIIYKMHIVGKTWKVTDILLDESSLLASYQSQFNGFINKNGSVDKLIDRIAEKLKENNKS